MVQDLARCIPCGIGQRHAGRPPWLRSDVFPLPGSAVVLAARLSLWLERSTFNFSSHLPRRHVRHATEHAGAVMNEHIEREHVDLLAAALEVEPEEPAAVEAAVHRSRERCSGAGRRKKIAFGPCLV